jgi:hypothetical protein
MLPPDSLPPSPNAQRSRRSYARRGPNGMGQRSRKVIPSSIAPSPHPLPSVSRVGAAARSVAPLRGGFGPCVCAALHSHVGRWKGTISALTRMMKTDTAPVGGVRSNEWHRHALTHPDPLSGLPVSARWFLSSRTTLYRLAPRLTR